MSGFSVLTSFTNQIVRNIDWRARGELPHLWHLKQCNPKWMVWKMTFHIFSYFPWTLSETTRSTSTLFWCLVVFGGSKLVVDQLTQDPRWTLQMPLTSGKSCALTFKGFLHLNVGQRWVVCNIIYIYIFCFVFFWFPLSISELYQWKIPWMFFVFDFSFSFQNLGITVVSGKIWSFRMGCYWTNSNRFGLILKRLGCPRVVLM